MHLRNSRAPDHKQHCTLPTHLLRIFSTGCTLQVSIVLEDKFRLEDLLSLQLHQYADDVGEIVDRAQKEEKMEAVSGGCGELHLGDPERCCCCLACCASLDWVDHAGAASICATLSKWQRGLIDRQH